MDLIAGFRIIVLAGTQRDQNGTAAVGRLIINPPGTRHSVVSEAGCIVLAFYENAGEVFARLRKLRITHLKRGVSLCAGCYYRKINP